MQRQNVCSSDLASVGYDSEVQILEIEFHGGEIYQYLDVPYNIYENLINASSCGQYFRAFIKNNYIYKKIE